MKVSLDTMPVKTMQPKDTGIKLRPQLTQNADQVQFSGNLGRLAGEVAAKRLGNPLLAVMMTAGGVLSGVMGAFGSVFFRSIEGACNTGTQVCKDIGLTIKSNNNKVGDILKELGYNKTAKALTEADILSPAKKLAGKVLEKLA